MTARATIHEHLPFSATGAITLLLGLESLALMLFQGATGINPLSLPLLALTSGVIALLVAIDYLIRRRYEKLPLDVAVGVLIVYILLIEIVTLADGLTYTALLYLILPFPAFFMFGRRMGYGISIGVMAWLTLKFFIFKPGWLDDAAVVNTYGLFAVALGLVVVIAQVVLRERANRRHAETLLAQLEASHAQLQRYADQVAELAATEERNRLARDIHDSLGHYLTVIGVQLEKAVLVHDDRPDETLAAVRTAKRLTDQALADVRQSVRALHHDQAPFQLRPALNDLLANAAALSFRLDFRLDGDESRYTRQQLTVLYRAAQEGLTNIQKHAQAAQVSLCIELGEREARMTLTDNGIGIKVNDPFHCDGMGLRGMRERLEVMHGRVTLTDMPSGGTQLTVIIPHMDNHTR